MNKINRRIRTNKSNSNFSASLSKTVQQQISSRPITVYFPKPLLSQGNSVNKIGKTTSVFQSKSVDKPVVNFLPVPLFQIAKTMCSILKSTHHLFQVEGGNVPKQASFLKSFPKPFAPNEHIKNCVNEIADQWSKKLCQSLQKHYNSTRLSNLVLLENSLDCSDEEWDSCLMLATKWTRSSLKNFSESESKESLDLINSARKKQQTLKELVVSSSSVAPPFEPLEVEEILECEPSDPVNVAVSEEPVESLSHTLSSNAVSFVNVGKKMWKIPENFVEKKLLITDEKFVGPVPNDFFHVTFPNCSVWDLNNTVRNSVLPKDISLVLIHVGYKSCNDNNLKYISTVAEKVKTSCPNAKVFFTSLVSKSVDVNIARFNKTCKDKYAEFFLDCDLREVNFTTDKDKSEKLFVDWIKALISKN
jgi:hypothetical protein